MTRIAAIAALVLAVGSPFPASAEDFGKTTWGMKLARVRKLYPGGVVAESDVGTASYSARQPFGPIKDARIVFEFIDEELNIVTVHFPRPGIPTDPKATDFAIMTNGQATEVFASLRKYLDKKHGKPSAEKVSWIGDRASIHLEWAVPGTPGTLILLDRKPLEEAEDLTDVKLEYRDGDYVYWSTRDTAPPADCSATPLNYTSMKQISRDRECSIGKTGEQVCRLDKVDAESLKIACDEGVYWLSVDPADVPKIETVKPGHRYLFTFRVTEYGWLGMTLTFMDARPAR